MTVAGERRSGGGTLVDRGFAGLWSFRTILLAGQRDCGGLRAVTFDCSCVSLLKLLFILTDICREVSPMF